eukprot:748443-Hanusia_phi.AAC.4
MAEIVQPDREDSSSSSSSDCWECTTCLKSIPGIIWQAGKRVKECEHSKEPQEDNKGKRSQYVHLSQWMSIRLEHFPSAVRQRQEVNPESGRAYPALSAIVPKNSWVVLSICVALVAVLLVPPARNGLLAREACDLLSVRSDHFNAEPSDASKSTIAVELKTPDLNSTDKSKTQSNNDAKGEDVPATISNSSNASSPTNSAQSGKEGSNQTQPVKPSPRWAELPVPRPLRLCSFQRDEVVSKGLVDLDWTWVVMADAMGWAHQAPSLGSSPHLKHA